MAGPSNPSASSHWSVCVLVRVKLVSETEAHLQAQRESEDALRASEELCQQLQRQLHHKRHQMEDLAAVKDHKYVPAQCVSVTGTFSHYLLSQDKGS